MTQARPGAVRIAVAQVIWSSPAGTLAARSPPRTAWIVSQAVALSRLIARGLSAAGTTAARQSGELELLVAEVGDELEGAAKGGDVAVQDILGGDVSSFDLGNPGN
jgi:hypothetical protein